MASLTTDNNDQKKGSSEKRTLNDSSTPPLSPMPNNTDVDFDPNLLSVNTTTTTGGSNSASLSSVSPSKRQKRDAKNISSSPHMEKYLNPFQDKWSSREDFNPKPQVRSAPQDAEVGTAGDKLVLVMVGLPARGKTYIARRVARYLQFFHGAPTKVFNVGNYRREISGAKVGSSFFSNKNAKSLAERQKAAEYAMRDLKQWLQEKNDKGRVGIFDATNTTKERREWIIQELAGIMESKSHIIFVESICNNEDIINENIRAVKLNMPDYKGENPEKAVEDFKKRIENYESIYQPISDEELSWVRLVDAGRQVTMNNIKGFLAGRVVQFLINLHFHPRPIYLSRHGQSEYNKLQKVGGDSGLSPAGEEYALALSKYVDEHILVDKIDGIDGNPMHARLFTSSLRRTKLTARHIKHDTLDDGWIVMRPKVLRNLDEIYAGVFDGYTYKEIQTVAPEEFEARSRNKLTYRYPRGESYLDVIDRLAPVIQEIERTKDPILIVGHQGILRIIYSYFMDYPREKAPFEKIPLNTIIKLIPDTYDCKEERKCLIPMSNEDKNTPSH
jgi:broad specificity phosphatase PhoE/predicted kinase